MKHYNRGLKGQGQAHRQDPVLVQGGGEDEKVLLLWRLGCFWQ